MTVDDNDSELRKHFAIATMATMKEPPYKPNRQELNEAIENILAKVCFFF
jgi:hypothetical protein